MSLSRSFAVSILSAWLACAAVAVDGRSLVRTWRTSDGLPQNTVLAIAQTPDSDSGHGIPDGDDGANIFEPYHTTKADGLGLGLSLSRSVVLAHGGELWAENNSGAGATFKLTLPEWQG